MPRRYIYRSFRQGGRVRRAFLGTLADPVARLHHQLQDLGQASAAAETARVGNEQSVLDRMDECLRLVATAANRCVRNLRKRRRRLQYKTSSGIRRTDVNEISMERADYDDLVCGAAEGCEQSLNELREVMKTNPVLFETLGNLNHHVQRHLMDLAAGDYPDTREAIELLLDQERDQWLEAGDSLPERLLIDQVLTTMLDACCCQLAAAQPHPLESTQTRLEKRLVRAQERHQRAVLALVEVRQVLMD